MTEVLHDTSHSLPSRADNGVDVVEAKIREAVDGNNRRERREREEELRREEEVVAEERAAAERALGEFLGFTMWPSREVEFEGGTRRGPENWEFRTARLVFKTNRVTSNVPSNEGGKRLALRDFSIEVASEFERVYGSRRLREAARRAGEDEYQKWEWHEVRSPADIAALRAEGKLEDR